VRRRVFVAGAGGQLGGYIVKRFADQDVIPFTRSELDITDPGVVRDAVASASPDVVINCAAFNDVDGAERRPRDAFAVNAFAVRSLARAAEQVGAAFVHYSTDFVFDGTGHTPYDEQSDPKPQSTYAMSKLVGEWFALEAPRGYVLRVESLFGSPRGWTGRRGTMDGIVSGLEQGREVAAFTDRIVSPSYTPDIAAATRHLVDTGAAPGLYHCVNTGSASWYEVAEELARQLKVTPRLKATTMDQVTLAAARPRYCALSNRKLAAAGFQMPSWQDAMDRWLAIRDQRPETRDQRPETRDQRLETRD
jgi:dTDP-4-dehydrorhamnose reductase